MKPLMRVLVLLIAVAVVAAACGDADDPEGNPPTTTDTSAGDGVDPSATAEIMAAAAHQLLTVDNTFGGGDVFDLHLVLDQTDPNAGDAFAGGGGRERPLTEGERSAIEDVLSDLGQVVFIENADDWRTDDLRPTKDGSVIVGLGVPAIDGSTASIGVSLWCGGVCGTWFTYDVEQIDGTWQVTGIDGPVAIS